MPRLILALAGIVVVVAGLSVHAFAPDGFVSAPRWASWATGSVALAWCVAVELFQLTGLPEQWGAAFRPLMLVFGTVFSPSDLLFYALGVAVAVVVDAAVRRRGSVRPRDTAGS